MGRGNGCYEVPFLIFCFFLPRHCFAVSGTDVISRRTGFQRDAPLGKTFTNFREKKTHNRAIYSLPTYTRTRIIRVNQRAILLTRATCCCLRVINRPSGLGGGRSVIIFDKSLSCCIIVR